ncbi:hypothetical protein PG984_006538 [Apiospora sp. TS-2023a]
MIGLGPGKCKGFLLPFAALPKGKLLFGGTAVPGQQAQAPVPPTGATTNKPAWDTDSIGQQRRSAEPRARDPEENRPRRRPGPTE